MPRFRRWLTSIRARLFKESDRQNRRTSSRQRHGSETGSNDRIPNDELLNQQPQHPPSHVSESESPATRGQPPTHSLKHETEADDPPHAYTTTNKGELEQQPSPHTAVYPDESEPARGVKNHQSPTSTNTSEQESDQQLPPNTILVDATDSEDDVEDRSVWQLPPNTVLTSDDDTESESEAENNPNAQGRRNTIFVFDDETDLENDVESLQQPVRKPVYPRPRRQRRRRPHPGRQWLANPMYAAEREKRWMYTTAKESRREEEGDAPNQNPVSSITSGDDDTNVDDAVLRVETVGRPSNRAVNSSILGDVQVQMQVQAASARATVHSAGKDQQYLNADQPLALLRCSIVGGKLDASQNPWPVVAEELEGEPRKTELVMVSGLGVDDNGRYLNKLKTNAPVMFIALNQMMKNLNLDRYDKIFIPSRLNYLRLGFVYIRNACRSYCNKSDMTHEWPADFEDTWFKHCRALERLDIDCLEAIQTAFVGLVDEFQTKYLSSSKRQGEAEVHRKLVERLDDWLSSIHAEYMDVRHNAMEYWNDQTAAVRSILSQAGIDDHVAALLDLPFEYMLIWNPRESRLRISGTSIDHPSMPIVKLPNIKVDAHNLHEEFAHHEAEPIDEEWLPRHPFKDVWSK